MHNWRIKTADDKQWEIAKETVWTIKEFSGGEKHLLYGIFAQEPHSNADAGMQIIQLDADMNEIFLTKTKEEAKVKRLIPVGIQIGYCSSASKAKLDASIPRILKDHPSPAHFKKQVGRDMHLTTIITEANLVLDE